MRRRNSSKLATDARNRIAQKSLEQEARSKARVAELEEQAKALEGRVERLREALSTSQEDERRVNDLVLREKGLRGAVGMSERRLSILRTDMDAAMNRTDELRDQIADLETQQTKLSNAVQLSGNGAENFEIAMNEVARVTSAAADMTLTNELLEKSQAHAFKDDQGQNRRFANDDAQDSLVVRLISSGFQKAVELFERIRSLTHFNKQIEIARTYPEPLMQMQNALDATDEAIKETLMQLGVADKRPDVGVLDENGDPPPVLELVFSRRDAKAKQRNKELTNRLGMSGPRMG